MLLHNCSFFPVSISLDPTNIQLHTLSDKEVCLYRKLNCCLFFFLLCLLTSVLCDYFIRCSKIANKTIFCINLPTSRFFHLTFALANSHTTNRNVRWLSIHLFLHLSTSFCCWQYAYSECFI